jgi:hypothetical protein
LAIFFALIFILPVQAYSLPCPESVCGADQKEQSFVSRFTGENLVKGAVHYWRTMKQWLTFWKKDSHSSASRKPGEGEACEDVNGCRIGLACLNTCADAACETMLKKCQPKVGLVEVLPQFAPCSANGLCAKGTNCLRSCPPGGTCEASHRCLMIEPVYLEYCESDSQCAPECGRRPLPNLHGLAVQADCHFEKCHCRIVEFDPDLKPTACPPGVSADVMSCPTGTRPACAPHLTCLAAPEAGGYCGSDQACQDVECAASASPFCDADGRCRCRKRQEEAVRCSNDAQCADVPCGSDESKTCNQGVCSCAKKVTKEVTCEAAADCPAGCAAGYTSACVDSKCLCQRTINTGPIKCSAVSECGAVACPAGYDKTCLNSQCACVKTTQPE